MHGLLAGVYILSLFHYITINLKTKLNLSGTTSYEGAPSNELKNAKINIFNSTMCSSVLTEFDKDWDSQICAGELDGSEDTCQGDSGGSLYVRDTVDGKTKFVTAGIVSYGVNYI